MITRLLLIVIFLTLHSVLFAAPTQLQSHSSIREAAAQHIHSQQGYYPAPPIVEVGRLDPRLRFPQCQQPLSTFTPTGGRQMGNITVGVRCDGGQPWSLFVPTRVRVMAEVLVTAQPLARGNLISADDLILQKRDLAALPYGYFQQHNKVIGKKAKRSLPQGSVLSPNQLESPKMVKRGDTVTILAKTAGFEVRMRGKALAHGTKGDRIQIKNLSSKRVIEGIVVSTGVVEIPL